MEQRYRLRAVDIVGSTRLQLRAPATAYSLLPNQTTYCNQYTGFPLVPVAPCRYLDSYDAVDPGLEQGAIFVSTRITESEQTISPECLGQPLPDCEYATQSTLTYYVGEPEASYHELQELGGFVANPTRIAPLTLVCSGALCSSITPSRALALESPSQPRKCTGK